MTPKLTQPFPYIHTYEFTIEAGGGGHPLKQPPVLKEDFSGVALNSLLERKTSGITKEKRKKTKSRPSCKPGDNDCSCKIFTIHTCK